MIIPDSNSASTGGYEIDNSLKLENDNAEQLYYTPSSAGNLKTWTYSCWFKRTELSYNMMLFGANDTYVYFETDDTLKLRFTGTYVFDTARVFRDTSAWTHIVVAVDTTQATEADRIKIYFNGEDQAGLFANDSFPAQNTNTSWNNTLVHYVAGWATASFNPSCYLAEVYNIDGQKLEATDFGEFDEDTGIWKPIEYTGTFGSYGYYWDFSNASNYAEDQSGTASGTSQMTEQSISTTTAMQSTDTPTNNFCIPQVTQAYSSTDTILFTEGGTKLTTGSGTGWRTMHPTMSLANGKWYFEVEAPATNPTSSSIMIAITPTKRWTESAYAHFYAGQASGDGLGWYLDSTRFRYDDGTAITPPTNTLNAGDIIGIALDMDNNFVYSSINGSWLQNQSSVTGVPTSGVSGTGAETISDEPHMIGISMYSPSKTININYGGYTTISIASGNSDANGYGNFEYAPPSGYYALCSKNLAEFG